MLPSDAHIPLRRLLLSLAGVVPALVEHLPQTDQLKYLSIGMLVFVATLTQAVGVGYAAWLISARWVFSIGFGLIWALCNFALDSFAPGTLRRRRSDGYHVDYRGVALRLVLIVMVAIVTSVPLKLALFDQQIRNLIEADQQHLAGAGKRQIAILEADGAALVAQRARASEQATALLRAYLAEVEGTGGRMAVGKGPVYAERRRAYEAAVRELSQLRDRTDAQLRENAQKIAQLRTTPVAATYERVTLLDRIAALEMVTNLSSTARMASLSISALMIFICLAPLLLKLASPPDFYEFVAEHQGDAAAIKRMSRILEDADEVAAETQKAFGAALTSSEFNPRKARRGSERHE